MAPPQSSAQPLSPARRFGPFLAGLCALALVAGGTREESSIAIRFHLETNTVDPTFGTTVQVGNPPRELKVEKMPAISERNIASFYPFKAEDGSFGAGFKLDRNGEIDLETLSTDRRAKFLLAVVNGRPITALTIDKPIKDGIIFIPFGLQPAEIRAMGQSFALMGIEKPSKRKPRPTPSALAP